MSAMIDETGPPHAAPLEVEKSRAAARNVGRVLSSTRTRAGLTQEEAAQLMRLAGKAYISKLETGAVPLRVERCVALCMRIILRDHSDAEIDSLAAALMTSGSPDLVRLLLRLSIRSETITPGEVEQIVVAIEAAAERHAGRSVEG